MDLDDIEKLLSAENFAATAQADDTPTGAMTLRDRFVRTMHYLSVDRLPNFEFGYWAQTLPMWHEQGLPTSVDTEAKAYRFFGIENYAHFPVTAGQCGQFEGGTISEDDDYKIYVDPTKGSTAKINKKGAQSIPHYLDFKLKTRDDLKEFIDKYDPTDSRRFPDDWEALAKGTINRQVPMGIHLGSLMGVPRDYMGFENFAMTIYDDPGLLVELIEAMTGCSETVLEKALQHFQPDFASGWEDICFNSGPIITPDFMEKEVVPRYQRITKIINRAGCDVIWTDTDGDINPIAHLFMTSGINTFFPCEVHGGSDPVALRKRFGKDALFWGGVCKLKLDESKAAVEKELLRIQPTVAEGGFIPTMDHRVQASAPLENYIFYLEKKREIFNVGGPEPLYRELGWGVNGIPTPA